MKANTRNISVILILALSTFLSNAPGADTPMTCALLPDRALGFSESLAYGLLEANLSKIPDLALLERAEVDKVFEEIAFQKIFDAQGVAERSRAGALLQARMLLILKAEEKQIGEKERLRHVTLAVCDARSGLRVLTERHLWDETNPEETANSLTKSVERMRQRLASEIRAVLTIPPFVSDDFTYRYNALRDAYAELSRQGVADVPGVFFVEIEEARAIAREFALTGERTVRHPLQPYFLLGRFRHEESDEGRLVKLTLQFSQDEKSLGEKSSDLLPEASAAEFLRVTTAGFLQEALGAETQPFNAAAQISRLLARAREHEKLGEYGEAFRLLQTAKLLDPADLTLRQRSAHLAIKHAIFQNNKYAPGSPEERVDKAIQADLSVLADISHLTRASDDEKVYNACVVILKSQFVGGRHIYRSSTYSTNPEQYKIIEELLLRRQETIFSILESMSDRGLLKSTVIDSFIYLIKFPTKGCNISNLRESKEAVAQRMYRLVRLMRGISYDSHHGDFAYEALPLSFLDPLASLPGKGPKVISATLRICYSKMTRDEKFDALSSLLDYVSTNFSSEKGLPIYRFVNVKKIALKVVTPEKSNPSRIYVPKRTTETTLAGSIVYSPVPDIRKVFMYFDSKYPGIGGRKFSSEILGVLMCADGSDLYYSKRRVALMRNKGELEEIYKTSKADIASATYDGKYAWFVRDGQLTILSPGTGQTVNITQEDGLLPGKMLIAPISPGRIFVVGYFGRTWAGTVHYETDGRNTVDVFHKAPLPQGDRSDPTVAFKPYLAITLSNPKRYSTTYVIVSGGGNRMFVFNLKARTVRVLENSISPYNAMQGSQINGDYYFRGISDGFRSVFKLSPPDFNFEVLFSEKYVLGTSPSFPYGRIIVDNLRCYIPGSRKSWKSELSKIDFQEIGIKNAKGTNALPLNMVGLQPDPRLNTSFGIFDTNHYGLLGFVIPNRKSQAWQITFDDTPLYRPAKNCETAHIMGGPVNECGCGAN